MSNYLLSPYSVPRHVFGKWRFSSDSGRVIGFCPHGVYVIAVEETNDKQANKSNIISGSKHYREYQVV